MPVAIYFCMLGRLIGLMASAPVLSAACQTYFAAQIALERARSRRALNNFRTRFFAPLALFNLWRAPRLHYAGRVG